MGGFINKAGRRFGRWTVTDKYESRAVGKKRPRKGVFWLCKCDCGTQKWVDSMSLSSGRTTSCGCLHKEIITTHGGHQERLYTTFRNMLARCYTPKSNNYVRYGAKNVRVLFTCFEDFAHWAMNNGYRDDLTIDRIDGGGSPYSRDNCRWVTRREQALNREDNIYVTNSETGETLCAADWSRRLGASIGLVYYRLKAGWDEQKAITTFSQRKAK